jgi:hypothetical protein
MRLRHNPFFELRSAEDQRLGRRRLFVFALHLVLGEDKEEAHAGPHGECDGDDRSPGREVKETNRVLAIVSLA